MKFSLPIAFFVFAFLMPKALISQCGSGPCAAGMPMWDQSSSNVCIAQDEFELDCASGTMPQGGVVDPPPSWCTTIENNIYYAFTASSSNVVFEVSAFNCSGGNGALQAAILDCNLDFVSDCFGNIPDGSTQVVVNTTPLVPGTVYLLCLDGNAGAICDFIINGALPSDPTGLPVCVGGPTGNNVGTYTSTQSGTWTINPPSAGVITSANPGSSATVEWLEPGNYEVCISACPNGNASCLDVEIGENLVEEIDEIVCLYDQAMCGTQTFEAIAPGIYPVLDIQPGANGDCDIVTICNFEVPVQEIVFEEAAVCLNEFYESCGFQFYNTGLWEEDCPNPLGCDDLLTVNLVVQDPTVILDDPVEAGCGSDWEAIISGLGSPNWTDPAVLANNGTTTIEWTGPGPVDPPNAIVATVTVPGEYCLTITHTTFGTPCTDTECVTVEQSLAELSPPDLDGPTNVCGGMDTYTVSPAPGEVPDSYTWTTPNGEPYTMQGNFSIVVDWANSPGGELCVVANNLCGPSDPTCITITVGTGPEDPILSGPDEACDGQTLEYEMLNPPSPSANATCTWTVPPGASFSQNGAIISVDFTGASNGDVCVTCEDQCGTSAPTCISVTINTVPDAPAFTSGPNEVCGSDTESYCVNNDPNATSWSWTSPAGNFPDTSSNCLTIDWTGLSSGNICVTANNECGSSPQTCFNVDIIEAPTATISGEGEFCTGSGDVIDLSISLTGTAPWEVTYTNGTTTMTESDIMSSPHIIQVTEAGTYILVDVTDDGICPGTVDGSAEVIEHPLPTATLSGSGDICLGSGDQVDLTITLTGSAPWEVVYENGAGNQSTLNIPNTPFTLPIGQAGAGTISLISVEDDNNCVGTVDGVSQVNVLDAPTTTVSTECNATNTEFVVTIVIENGDPNTYSVTPLSGTLVGNVFTSNPIPHGNGYSFIVTDANNCNPSDVSDNIVVCDCTTEVGLMDDETLETCGDGPITAFAYDDTDQVLDGDDVQMYVLHSGNSASIVPPIIDITPTPSVSFDPGTMSYGEVYYFSAAVGNADATQGIDLNDPCLQVAQGTPVVFYEVPTATIAGSAEICIGENTGLTIELTGVSPWIVTINGEQINVLSTPYMYVVDPDATTDYVLTEVSDGNNCVNAATGTETITVNTSPEVINVEETCNGSGTAYTVTFEITGGDPSCYSVTPMDGTLTGNIFTSNEIADGLPYFFEISDCNDCPTVIIEKPLVDCNCLSEAGDIVAGDFDVCGTDVAPVTYDIDDEFLDADDALCYILHSGNPLSPIATSSTFDNFSFDAATMVVGTQYFICPVVGNDDGSGCVDLSDPCLSIGGCAQVTFREIPTALLIQGDDICAGTIGNLTVEFTGAGPWTFEYQDVTTGTINTLQATNSPFTFDVSPTTDTDYSLVSMVGSFCDGLVDGAATVSVNDAPQATVLSMECNATSTAYTVTFEITGGDPSTYEVVPANGTLNGNIFISNPYDDSDAFFFEIDDQFDCGPTILEDSTICNCLTDAGIMPTDLLSYCPGDVIESGVTMDSVLDADDIIFYVLHTGSGNSLGAIIATNTVPIFTFDSTSMSSNVTYYISAVAGNALPNGDVDLTDFCLSVAAGTPIMFNDPPTASISGSTTICDGQDTDIILDLTGTGPFSVVYEVGWRTADHSSYT